MRNGLLAIWMLGVTTTAMAEPLGEIGRLFDEAEPIGLTAAFFATQDSGSDRVALDADARAFAAGTWTFQAYGSGTFGDSDKGEIYTGHVGFGYYFVDDLSINFEAFGGWVTPELDDDGGVGGFDLLFRWHFINEENYSFYMDGGAGFQQATTNFPSDSHHNFRPQFGLGATVRLFDNARLMGGIRWLHISNAGTTDGNDGLDGAQIYAGLMVPF